MLDHADSDTVGDSAYRQLRNDIIFGRLKPAEKLRLEPLRVRYGVSVTTLREILNRLTSDGFVFAEGQKGFQVLPVSATDLRELADLRIMIEGHALRQSFAMGDLDWEAEVVASYHKLHVLETRVMAGAEAMREEWKNADWQFHRATIAACQSRNLMEVHGAIFDKYLRYQMMALTFRGEIAAREHKALLDAALAHDADAAIAVLKAHVEGGVEHALANNASLSA